MLGNAAVVSGRGFGLIVGVCSSSDVCGEVWAAVISLTGTLGRGTDAVSSSLGS